MEDSRLSTDSKSYPNIASSSQEVMETITKVRFILSKVLIQLRVNR